MSILKAQTHWSSNLYIVRWGRKGGKFGILRSILEALIINTESEKVQILFIGLSKK